ncbi:hypothetical protein LTR50_007761 [Elasticomyces elasticus]|nr:hypothetical protein LTR50_007761 [Elasticomyces elasticus]
MGIHGIYKEIGPGTRVALSKLSIDHYVTHNRPLRLAIDISIWLFQIQSGKGGTNPALRTFYYRLLRLLSLNIHPLFVFDGPNKPLFKRHKKVGGGSVKVCSVPEFLAKQLLKQFGFPAHVAPGEAEAECALLQREGVVDAVLSEDVDTLMFGSGLTIRNWSPELKSSKVPTHVNVYNAKVTKDGSGLDREGMILIALMSGGDYIPEGVKGCGPKVACEAARAGFGSDLCRLRRKDALELRMWRDRLQHELRTNESQLFKRRHGAVIIPEDFPNLDVLGYYTHPCISSPEKVAQLRGTLKWDNSIDVVALREFTKDAFDWRCVGGAKKFVRNLAPALLVRDLCRFSEAASASPHDISIQEEQEAHYVQAIHGKRTHTTTGEQTELRISFIPLNLVEIDLSIEEPDEELPSNDSESEGEFQIIDGEDPQCPSSPKKKRGPSTYDPAVPEKMWILETFVRLGTPLKVQDWEESFRDARKYMAMKAANRKVGVTAKGRRGAAKENDKSGMPKGALDRFAKVTKPGVGSSQMRCKSASLGLDEEDSSLPSRAASLQPSLPVEHVTKFAPLPRMPVITETDLPPLFPYSRGWPVRRETPEPPWPQSRDPFNPSLTSPPCRAPKSRPVVIDLLSSPLPRCLSLTPTPPNLRFQFKPDVLDPPLAQPDFVLELPSTVMKRRRTSPMKRSQSTPVRGEDSNVPAPLYRLGTWPPPPEPVDAMDLASSPSLPSPSLLMGTPTKPVQVPVGPRSRAEWKKAATETVEISSSPRAPPPTTITEWIRRSASVTPTRARHANFINQKQPDNSLGPLHWSIEEHDETFDPVVLSAVEFPSSSIPTPPPEKNATQVLDSRTAPAKPTTVTTAPSSSPQEEQTSPHLERFLPSIRRLKDRTHPISARKSKAKAVMKQHSTTTTTTTVDNPNRKPRKSISHQARTSPIPPPTTTTSTTTSTTTAPPPHHPRRSTRHPPTSTGPQNPPVAKKKLVKLRDSLHGSWKLVNEDEIEQADLTGEVARKTVWRESGIMTFDLTCD